MTGTQRSLGPCQICQRCLYTSASCVCDSVLRLKRPRTVKARRQGMPVPALFEVHDVSSAASGDNTGGRAFVARVCGRMPAHCRHTRATQQQDYSTTTCVCACVSANVCTPWHLRTPQLPLAQQNRSRQRTALLIAGRIAPHHPTPLPPSAQSPAAKPEARDPQQEHGPALHGARSIRR